MTDLFKDNDGDVARIFAVWRVGQKNPDRMKLTATRRKLIERRLQQYTANELCLLIEYAFEANTREARFWRGEEQSSGGRTYIGLDNLLRVSKIPARLDNARRWRAQKDDHEVTEGVMLSFVGQMRQRPKKG